MNEIHCVQEWLETLDFSAWRFSENSYSLWLKLRNSEPFDWESNLAFLVVNERERDNTLGPNELEILSQVNQKAFSKTLEATNVEEIAICVGDDFELIARAARVGLDNGWLRALHNIYNQERFPFGTLGGA